MSQLPLPIDWSERGEAGMLLMTGANADAVVLLRSWQHWPSPATLLVGPARSGKSLMGRLFVSESGGEIIDDADRVDETQLFNRWNLALESRRPLLLIAQEAPPLWPIALPDLRTRLATAAVARIATPNEEIAAALIVHGLERGGSAFAPDLPEFVARRVTRCYETIDRIVTELNAELLTSGRKLTVKVARDLLAGAGFMPSGEDMDEGAETRG